MATEPPEPSAPDASKNSLGIFSESPDILLISANAAAFAALAAFWKDIPKGYSANFTLSLMLFAIGVLFAIYSCYCRYIESLDHGDERKRWRPPLEPLLVIVASALVLAVLAQDIFFTSHEPDGRPIRSWFNWVVILFGFLGAAGLLCSPWCSPNSWLVRQADPERKNEIPWPRRLSRHATLGALICFMLGIGVAIGAFTTASAEHIGDVLQNGEGPAGVEQSSVDVQEIRLGDIYQGLTGVPAATPGPGPTATPCPGPGPICPPAGTPTPSVCVEPPVKTVVKYVDRVRWRTRVQCCCGTPPTPAPSTSR